MLISIASLLNIAKWAYFIIVAKAHIDIRREHKLKLINSNSNDTIDSAEDQILRNYGFVNQKQI